MHVLRVWFLCGLMSRISVCVTGTDSPVMEYILQELDSLKSEVRENSKLIQELRNERDEDKARITELTEQLRDTSEQFDTFRTLTRVRDDNVPDAIPNTLGSYITEKRKNDSTNQPEGPYRNPNDNAEDTVDKDVITKTTTDHASERIDDATEEKHQQTIKQGSKRLLAESTQSPNTQERVAFSAYMSGNALNLGSEQIIPFDVDISNAGGAFDTVSHMFVCPFDGMYFFHSSLLSYADQHVQTELVKDGVVLVQMYASGVTGESASISGYDQGANVVIVACNKGEHVWVRQHEGDKVAAYKFSTFSGFLLFTL